jgi:hypothetical protein
MNYVLAIVPGIVVYFGIYLGLLFGFDMSPWAAMGIAMAFGVTFGAVITSR